MINSIYVRLFSGALLCLILAQARAEVPSGSEAEAKEYYSKLSLTLNYATPATIGETTLTDLAAYLGYGKISADELEFAPPESLMARGEPRGILVSRFFAPKIMNVKFRETSPEFRLGWRKLVRIKAMAGSSAKAANIVSAVILFNFFPPPGRMPYERGNFSVNTQVMLLPDPVKITPLRGQKGDGTMDTVYWLDYQNTTSAGPGKLGYFLHASFDANELPGAGTKNYYVPHGCVACHGNNMQRPLLNFMDTDHWFDRLENDFPQLKDSGQPLLFDAGTNDPTSPQFKKIFDIIRTFNHEADQHAKQAQPRHDETLASAKWMEIHANNDAPVPPLKRAIGPAPQWSANTPGDEAALATLNQYCYRCHGTVKFSVFNRQAVMERRANILQRILPTAEVGMRMPPDRELPPDKLELLQKFLSQ